MVILMFISTVIKAAVSAIFLDGWEHEQGVIVAEIFLHLCWIQ